MGEFHALASDGNNAKDLMDAHIKAYVQFLVSRSNPSTIDPTIIKSALVGSSMLSNILHSKARVTNYYANFSNAWKVLVVIRFLKLILRSLFV